MTIFGIKCEETLLIALVCIVILLLAAGTFLLFCLQIVLDNTYLPFSVPPTVQNLEQKIANFPQFQTGFLEIFCIQYSS